MNDPWLIAVILKPLFMIILFGLIVLPIKILLERIIPDGRIKMALFRDRGRNA